MVRIEPSNKNICSAHAVIKLGIGLYKQDKVQHYVMLDISKPNPAALTNVDLSIFLSELSF